MRVDLRSCQDRLGWCPRLTRRGAAVAWSRSSGPKLPFAQRAAATRTTLGIDAQHRFEPLRRTLNRGGLRGAGSQQLADHREFFLAISIGQESVMANPHEVVGQHVRQKATDELIGRQCFSFAAVTIATIAICMIRRENSAHPQGQKPRVRLTLSMTSRPPMRVVRVHVPSVQLLHQHALPHLDGG